MSTESSQHLIPTTGTGRTTDGAGALRQSRCNKLVRDASCSGRGERFGNGPDPGDAESACLAQLQQLVFVVQRLSRARDAATIHRIVCAHARQLAGADGATFIRREMGECHYAEEDAKAPLWKGRRFPLERCISGWSMLQRAPVVVEDIEQDPRIVQDMYRQTFVRSLAVVPVRSPDPVGAIGVYWEAHRRPTAHQLSLLQAVADSAAAALDNIALLGEMEERVRERTRALEAAYEEFRHLALIDDLTALRNRRGFFLLAQQQRRQAARSGDPAFIVFVDVDGLKQVNDTLGHEAGDQLLRNAAQVLQTTFRDSDIIARLGGDEFCVLAVDGICNPQMIRERLERNISAFNAGRAGGPFPLAASIGIYPCAAEDQTPLEELVRRADQDMYTKKKGCRCVINIADRRELK